ncbi:ATPase domain-containing protein [Paeniroseomonas aquatica]|uniref:ATPase domain-containing protein n=1 Tax=Paeniroseomonas aquatica TaxID=373043 RepID=UPI003620038A
MTRSRGRRRPKTIPRISTGSAGLDDILGGGVDADRLYLVEGRPGAGKTTLALQSSSPASPGTRRSCTSPCPRPSASCAWWRSATAGASTGSRSSSWSRPRPASIPTGS